MNILITKINNNVNLINNLNEYYSYENIHIFSLCEKIYSDCLRTYKPNDFKENTSY